MLINGKGGINCLQKSRITRKEMVKVDRFEVMFDSEIENIKLRTRTETAKQIFEEQERHVLNELALVAVKIQKEKDNVIWKQDKGNLEEWLRFIKEQRAKFLQGKE